MKGASHKGEEHIPQCLSWPRRKHIHPSQGLGPQTQKVLLTRAGQRQEKFFCGVVQRASYYYYFFYLEGRGEVVLEEPELDRGLGVLEDREHHYSTRERERKGVRKREQRERERK